MAISAGQAKKETPAQDAKAKAIMSKLGLKPR